MLVGAPGSGKTWVSKQLEKQYCLIANDTYIGEDYVAAIKAIAPVTPKKVLIETPFSMSQLMEPLEDAGYMVEPIIIAESAAVHTARYEKRTGKPIPKGHLTRTKTYLDRARSMGYFYGTSEEVLKYLQTIAE